MMRAGEFHGTAQSETLRVPATVAELAAVREFVRRVAGGQGVGQEAIDDLVQAVDESVTNVVVHGYRGRAGIVEVEIERRGTEIVARLRDRAPPFDPTLLPAPDLALPLELRPPGGMGVFLTRELMDRVTYQSADGTNELTLVKQGIKQEEVRSVEADRRARDEPGGLHRAAGGG